MNDFVKKYPSKKETLLHVFSLLTIPFMCHYLLPELFFLSFFIIPTIVVYSWLENVELCRTENKKEYIIVRTFVKMIPLLSGIIAIRMLS
tara:strand:+ start:3732 stop:4001 length:270 start_codon:yes stop_codon:yes gene_type:complete